MATGYVFFETDLRDRFVQGLVARALESSTREDVMEGWVVELAAEPSDEVMEAIEADYEALMQEQMQRAEARPDWGSHQVASLNITRADGSPAVVRLPPAVARPLMEHFSAEEAHALVTAIAHSLENPVDGPLCRKDLLKTRPQG
ncbi:hypothetical protein [Curvibacter sp. PAE-UM]|uniref:hypothetical protein n=1 Tax=Curvibacter sp. PAE-UM TaxID=1714344 RepID=UPI0007092560|nr:hypothetical protein [Curvibacter sp. PAE-UM]KRH99935.1 hypothetical protein AO057_02020 [Curvibacter sp. PAE-UM]